MEKKMDLLKKVYWEVRGCWYHSPHLVIRGLHREREYSKLCENNAIWAPPPCIWMVEKKYHMIKNKHEGIITNIGRFQNNVPMVEILGGREIKNVANEKKSLLAPMPQTLFLLPDSELHLTTENRNKCIYFGKNIQWLCRICAYTPPQVAGAILANRGEEQLSHAARPDGTELQIKSLNREMHRIAGETFPEI